MIIQQSRELAVVWELRALSANAGDALTYQRRFALHLIQTFRLLPKLGESAHQVSNVVMIGQFRHHV